MGHSCGNVGSRQRVTQVTSQINTFLPSGIINYEFRGSLKRKQKMKPVRVPTIRKQAIISFQLKVKVHTSSLLNMQVEPVSARNVTA